MRPIPLKATPSPSQQNFFDPPPQIGKNEPLEQKKLCTYNLHMKWARWDRVQDALCENPHIQHWNGGIGTYKLSNRAPDACVACAARYSQEKRKSRVRLKSINLSKKVSKRGLSYIDWKTKVYSFISPKQLLTIFSLAGVIHAQTLAFSHFEKK